MVYNSSPAPTVQHDTMLKVINACCSYLIRRASELLVALGGSLVWGTIQENGATFVTGILEDHEGGSHKLVLLLKPSFSMLAATLFPAGSIHFQQNLNCTV
jgi:hypothetical protein